MSNISDRATIIPFKSGETKPLTDQVLVKAFGGKTKIAAVCISVPKIADDDIIARSADMLPALRAAIREARREILAAAYHAKQTSIAHDEVNLDACIAKMMESSKLEEVEVREWFSTCIRDSFTVAFADKARWDAAELTAEQQQKIDHSANAALAAFIAAVCKKGAYLAIGARQSWAKLIDLAECDDDPTTAKIRAFFAACESEDSKQADALGLGI